MKHLEGLGMRFESDINMNIPKHWKVVKIEEIGKVVGGGTPSTKVPEYFGGDIAWITPKDLSGYNSRYISKGERNITEIGLKNSSAKLMPKNTVLLSSRAPIGYVAIAENEISTNQGFKSVICNEEKINPEYLYYVLKVSKKRLESIASGTTFKEVSGKKVKEFKIPLPPLNEQNNIISVLSNLDKKIELNNSIISNLEELAQILFKRWFVDFEFPNEEGKPYKSSGGKMVESELGMIPEGWEVRELNDIVQHSKKTFNPKREKQVEVAHFSLPAYDSQQYPIIEDSKTIKSNKYYIDDNSVMFSRMNPKTPRTWLPNIQNEYINVCSSEYVVLDTSLYSNKGYIYSLIRNDDFNNYLINNATGSTNSRQRVRPVISLQYTFPFNKNVMRKFELKIEAFYKEIINLREEIYTLTNLRDTLLPKLLSGEIELSDEEEVKELV